MRVIPRARTLISPFSTRWRSSGAIPFLVVWGSFVFVAASWGIFGGFFFLLGLSGITVEEEIDHNVPWSLAGELSLETEDLTAEEPVDQTNGVLGLVVGGDHTINTTNWGVSVADGDGWDVSQRSFLEGLRVSSGIGDDDQTGFDELGLDLIGKGTRGESASDGFGSSEVGELEDGTLAIRTSRDETNISGLFNGNNHASSENDLLVGLLEVEQVHSSSVTLPDVALHLGVTSTSTEVHVASQHFGNVVKVGNINIYR